MAGEAINEGDGSKGGKIGKGCLIAVAVFIGIGVVGAMVGGDEATDAPPPPSLAANDAPQESGSAETESTPSLTGPQRNAARSAESYLRMTGFSRKGLIEQLSSDAGEGYDVGDATAAVDSLQVDWNQQAVRSAEEYLKMMGFSCKGLVEQLSSDAGSGYTVEEATFGANEAGAC